MKHTFIVIIASLFTYCVKGQSSDCVQVARDIPCMYVPTQISKARVAFFDTVHFTKPGKTKREIFNGSVKGDHPLKYNFPVATFDTLIKKIKSDNDSAGGTGFRILFGLFDAASGWKPPFPMGHVMDGQVLLFFGGSKGENESDIGKYYFVSPKNLNVYILPPNIKDHWIVNFLLKVNNVYGLISTIDQGSRHNRTRIGGAVVPSDTRSLYYKSEDFLDYIQCERAYQDSIEHEEGGIAIDHIEIDFASLPREGIPDNANDKNAKSEYRYGNRLIVQYEFIRNEEVVDIEKTKCFSKRNRKCNSFIDKRLGADNGQLCPSQCPR